MFASHCATRGAAGQATRPSLRCSGLLVGLGLAICVSTASPAWSGDKGAPAKTPKLRQVADLPEDYLGRTFTYKVRISTNQAWMNRSANHFFLFVQDAEGNKLPNRGFSPDSTVNLIRFVVSKEEGRKLIERLSAGQMYEAQIRFTVQRQQAFLGQGWDYLAIISSVEVR
jgi:hypothetical protein